MTVLQKLNKTSPNFHPGSETVAVRGWALQHKMLRWLQNNLESDSIALETGSGWSTCVMLGKAKHVITIDPFTEKFDRISAWLDENDVEHKGRWSPLGEPSYEVLPQIGCCLPGKLDVVLIDGLHSFPVVQLDWFYTAQHLNVGGVVILDDLKIWSVAVLFQFLKDEPDWHVVHKDEKSAIVRLINPFRPYRSHVSQQYVMDRSTCKGAKK